MHTIICTSSAHKSNPKNLEFQIFEEINELLILTTTEKSPLFQKHVLTNSNFLVSFLGIFLHIGTFIFNQSSFQLWIGLQFGRIKVYINFPWKDSTAPQTSLKPPRRSWELNGFQNCGEKAFENAVTNFISVSEKCSMFWKNIKTRTSIISSLEISAFLMSVAPNNHKWICPGRQGWQRSVNKKWQKLSENYFSQNPSTYFHICFFLNPSPNFHIRFFKKSFGIFPYPFFLICWYFHNKKA